MPSYIFKSQLSTILSTDFVDRNSSHSSYEKMQDKNGNFPDYFPYMPARQAGLENEHQITDL